MTPRRPGRRTVDDHGFSLIEALVALTVIGVTLLLTMALLAQEPALGRRLSAQEEALQVLDAVHETMRAGLHLDEGVQDIEWRALFEPGFSLRAAEDLHLWSETTPQGNDGLFRVTLHAEWQAGGRSYERTVETMVWRP